MLREEDNSDGQRVMSAFVCAQPERRELTGAGEDACTLAIDPVQVKHKKGNLTVQTYAFLDPNS